MARVSIAKPRIATRDTRHVRPPAPKTNSFYLTPEWRGLVAALIARRGRRCQRCGKTHDESGGPVTIYGDHMVELRDGGAPLDPRNVQLMCGACHNRKTVEERAKRMRS